MRKIFMPVFTVLLIAAGVQAVTITVDLSGGADFTSIQPALDTALAGDTVIVGPGTYTGEANRNLNFAGKDIRLIADSARVDTVLDCESLGRAFFLNNGESSAALIKGFSIVNGYHSSSGGAIYCYSASPTLVDCSFETCESVQGGAIYALGSGAGMSIENCGFLANSAAYGGAIYATGILAPTASGCDFDSNTSDLKGGAIYCTNSSSGLIEDCGFSANSSLAGGAVFLNLSSSPTINGCLFTGNSADDGGAIGAFNNCAPEITQNTFVRNSATEGSSIHVEFNSSATIHNCILAYGLLSNSLACATSTPVTYHNLAWSNGAENLLCGDYHDNLYLNPEFCGLDNNGPYTLQSDSPAAAANNGYGEHMGAYPVDCDEAAAAASNWGELKSRY